MSLPCVGAGDYVRINGVIVQVPDYKSIPIAQTLVYVKVAQVHDSCSNFQVPLVMWLASLTVL